MIIKLIKFFFGLLILSGVFLFFASGVTPPGLAGEVLRHNQTADIDASPLFYSEVENMSDLEDGLKAIRGSVKNTPKNRGSIY